MLVLNPLRSIYGCRRRNEPCFYLSSATPRFKQPEEVKAVAMRSRNGLGYGTQRAINLPFEGEALLQDGDVELVPLVKAGQDGARQRQTAVDLGPRSRR